MARIVLGIGTSHSPLLPMTAEEWAERARDDMGNARLNLSDGRFLSYAQLEAEVAGRYAGVVNPENFLDQWKRCQRALDRLGRDLSAARPDVVVIVGDDQEELFRKTNIPAIAIYHGAEIVTRPIESLDVPRWLLSTGVGSGYGMEVSHRYLGAPQFGTFLIERLIEEGFDVGAVSRIEDARAEGLGHAYGFVIQRLLGARAVPVVPVLLNTYYPPNSPTPARCHALGQALRRAIEICEQDLRVAIVASGGLSHFVCDEDLDRRVLTAIQSADSEVLCQLPRAALHAGSSEILNWIAVAGAMQGQACRWCEYVPVRRTPAGTGIGMAFLCWQ